MEPSREANVMCDVRERMGAVVLVASLLAGCGGGQTPSAVKGSNKTPQDVSVSIRVPSASRTSASARKPRFVSPSTNGVLVRVYAHSDGTHQTVLAQTAVD